LGRAADQDAGGRHRHRWLRRTYQKKEAKAPIHMVSAFAARQRLVLGQVKVNERSNEIVAIPALLHMMAIEGAVVTIDAKGCQRDIAKKITDKKASRKQGASRKRQSVGTRRSMAITGASKPEPTFATLPKVSSVCLGY
jgi:hypothetical protein